MLGLLLSGLLHDPFLILEKSLVVFNEKGSVVPHKWFVRAEIPLNHFAPFLFIDLCICSFNWSVVSMPRADAGQILTPPKCGGGCYSWKGAGSRGQGAEMKL